MTASTLDENFTKNVAFCFENAALTYNQNSGVQRIVASNLARKIADISLPKNPSILEIGCGTGHLTERLVSLFPDANIIATDISKSMVDTCRTRLEGNEQITFVVMDGSKLATSGTFDLVCSSLALQWFCNLPETLSELTRSLKKNGLLAVSLLSQETFCEWRDAHKKHGFVAGTLHFHDTSYYCKSFPPGDLSIENELYIDQPKTILDFLRSLRAIGADTPCPGHRKLSVAELRLVLREFDTAPRITYDLIYAFLVNNSQATKYRSSCQQLQCTGFS